MTQFYEEYKKPFLHKDSYQPVSMMECHMRVLNITQLRCSPSSCHGSKRKNYEKIHGTESSCWRFPTPAVINFRFGCPKITKPLVQFHVWHQQRCKNLEPPKNRLIRVAYQNPQGLIGIFVCLRKLSANRRHQNLQTAGLCSCPSHGN